MPVITIEAASPSQIPAVRELFREYAAGLGFDLSFQKFDDELAALPGEYAPPEGRLLLAEVDGRPAACIALHRFGDEGTCEMKRLYVRPEFRGRAVGRSLVARLIEEARKIGYRRMRLDTVAGEMEAAIALYRSFGFREIPPYRSNPQPGALFLELDLR
jgi:putative acetyltransferase